MANKALPAIQMVKCQQCGQQYHIQTIEEFRQNIEYHRYNSKLGNFKCRVARGLY